MISSASSAVVNRPWKKSSGFELALVGDDGGAERQAGRRIIGGRIVVGERAADGALVAHRRIADQAGQFGQRRDRLARRSAEVATSSCVAVAPITSERPFISMPSSPSIWLKVDQMRRAGEPLLHDRQQRVAAGDQLGVLVLRPADWRPAARSPGDDI